MYNDKVLGIVKQNLQVITLAKSLIKTWKKLLDNGEKKKEESGGDRVKEERKKEEDKRDKARMEVKGSFTGDEVRSRYASSARFWTEWKNLIHSIYSRCRDLLLGAIKGDELPEGIDMCRWSQ